MKVVMEDQARVVGYSVSEISAFEKGAAKIPLGYVSKLIEWMQLKEDEASELKLLAHLKGGQTTTKGGSGELRHPLDVKL